jgi:hypothetical protein
MSPFSENLFRTSFNFPEIEGTIESTMSLAASHPESLYLFFQRYTYFNGYASALISRLASSIALSRYSFVQAGVPVFEEADRGMEIAAQVLAAAADEGANGVPHRALAQVTLKTIGDYANLSTAERNRFADQPTWMTEIVESLIAKYQGNLNDVESLIKSMGFHAASELLGDRENTLIDKAIRFDRQGIGFDAYLKKAKPSKIQGHAYHPWCYILIHGSYGKAGVEAEHFEYALRALNMSALYSSESERQVLEWALAGFSDFVELQQKLFHEIYRECLGRTKLSAPLLLRSLAYITYPSLSAKAFPG